MSEKPQFKPTEPSSRTYYQIQAIVKRPDGSLIRPCALVLNQEELLKLRDTKSILQLVLKNYDNFKESELVQAWIEITTVTTNSTHHEINLKR